MRDYIKPWRRKLGAMTLVITCVFAVGWIRGLFNADAIEIDVGEHGFALISSSHHAFCVAWGRNTSPNSLNPLWYSLSCQPIPVPLERWYGLEKRNWSIFGITSFRVNDEAFNYSAVLIYYWSIVIPLTLVSSWLLLSKPRTKSSKIRCCKDLE